MAKRYCYKDLLPFGAMVIMECANVALNTLFKAATLKGMSNHVFVVYAYAVAAIVLSPAPFFSRRLTIINLIAKRRNMDEDILSHFVVTHSIPTNIWICDNIILVETRCVAAKWDNYLHGSLASYNWIIFFSCVVFYMSLCRSRVLPPLSFPILWKIGLLGLIGWVHTFNCHI